MLDPDAIRFLIFLVPVIFILYGMLKPVYAVIGYMVLVVCKSTEYFSFFVQIRAELLLAIIILIRLSVGINSLKRLFDVNNRINLYLFLFVLCIAVSYFFAWDQEVSWDYSVYHFIKTAIIFVMVTMAVDSEKKLKLFVWSYVLMFVYLAYEPVYGFITKTGGDVHLYGVNYIAKVGPLSGHVALANTMNQMIPIAFFLMISVRKKMRRIIAAIPLTIFFIALMGSGSRAGVLGFIFFAVLICLFSKKKVVAIILISVVVILIFLTSTTILSTASRISTEQTYGRFKGLTHGIGMLRFGHVFGVGPGCFALARREYFGFGMDSHNIYGELIGELGIPGTIVWFLLIYESLMSLKRSRVLLTKMSREKSFLYWLSIGLQASLLVRLFISMGSHGLYNSYWYIMASLSATLLVVVKKASDESTLQEPPPVEKARMGLSADSREE